MGPGPIWAGAHVGQGPYGPGPTWAQARALLNGQELSQKMCPGKSNMFYVFYGCLRMCFYASWQNFTNMVSPANLTATSRTASKFCSRNRSQSVNIFDLDPIS